MEELELAQTTTGQTEPERRVVRRSRCWTRHEYSRIIHLVNWWSLVPAEEINLSWWRSPPEEQRALWLSVESFVLQPLHQLKFIISHQVTKQDVSDAYDLLNEATFKSAVDPLTGKIDMQALRTGVSVRERELMDLATKILQESVFLLILQELALLMP